MYAILDIETTGGKFNEEGITEIAIHKYDGHEVVDTFISLVNPEREIQEFVVKLTGINNKMLKNAPKFYEVAKRIIEITEDCILIAHNASFDYRILRTEFKRLGFDYQKNTLCTVQLSQKLIPEAVSYSLGKLCRSLGIPVTDRHRANGDALATIQLFKLLQEKDTDKKIIEESVKYTDNRTLKNKSQEILATIPEKEGVFYLQDEQGKIIFIGRSKNMKNEVNRVFLKTSKRAEKLQKRVMKASYELTGNELFTRLKYYTELEVLKPKFNIIKSKRKLNQYPFNSDDMLLIDKGREVEENAVVLIQNNEVYGYGYTNLAYQEYELEILKSVLTPLNNKALAKTIIKNYLKNKNVQRIIRL